MKKKLSVILLLLLFLVSAVPFSCSEAIPSLIQRALAFLDYDHPLGFRFTIQVEKSPVYGEGRTEQLNRLLKHFSFDGTIHESLSELTVLLDQQKLFGISQINLSNQERISLSPADGDPFILPQMNDSETLLPSLQSATETYLREKSIFHSLYSYVSLISRLPDAFPEKTGSSKILEKYRYYGTATRRVTVNITGEELNDYTEADIYAYIPAQIDSLLNPLQQMNGCPQDIRDKFLSSMLAILKANENTYTSFTGLIFWGFGENDFFPSYYEYNISIAFDGRLKYFLVKSAETEQCGAAIASFAQTDMAITLMRGIAPDLSEECYKFYGKSIDEFKTELSAQLQAASAPQALLDIINAIDVTNKAQKYRDGIEDFIKINHTDKLLEAIGYLSKEDLADIAENMVSMTYLNRRFTSQEESVGGPVDVAVITKGDGFVWIKRKHYFDASINQQFFERYNK